MSIKFTDTGILNEDIEIVLVAYQFEGQCQVESSCDTVNMWWNATSRMQNVTVPCH